MRAEDVIAVGAQVVVATQFVKWSGLPDRFGPLIVIVLSALLVAVWGLSSGTGWSNQLLWPYTAGFIGVATTAAGVYGFTRSAAIAIASANVDKVTRAQAVAHQDSGTTAEIIALAHNQRETKETVEKLAAVLGVQPTDPAVAAARREELRNPSRITTREDERTVYG